MAITITFDSVNITSDPYFIRQFLHDSWGARRLERQSLSRDRGVAILDAQFGEKAFDMRGKIIQSSQSNLESQIDTLKELLSRQGKNLDVSYAGGTRRYVAYVEDLKIERDHYHIQHADFSCRFVIPSGVGYDPSIQNHSNDNNTGATESGSFTVAGSAPPKGVITISFDSASSCSKVEFTLNGVKMTIEQTFSTSDVLVIDTDRKKVTLNGVEKDFSGRFPDFIVGSNSYLASLTRTSAQFDIDIDWYNTYL